MWLPAFDEDDRRLTTKTVGAASASRAGQTEIEAILRAVLDASDNTIRTVTVA